MINRIVSFVSWKAFGLIVSASLVVGGLSAGVDHSASVYNSNAVVSIKADNAKVRQENEALKVKPCDTINAFKHGKQLGILSVDTSKYFANGFNYGKWYTKDSISRIKSIKRWNENGASLVVDGDHFTVSGTNIFTKTGKLGSHIIKTQK